MYQFTIPMALMDFVPELFFGITAVLLLRDLYGKMSISAYVLLAAGSVDVFLAGFCKALWKLLYAAGVCDFVALEKMFMPVNSIGLLFVGVSLILMLCRKRPMLSVAPVVFTGSLPFIVMMVAGLGGLCAGLSVLAAKMKKKPAIVLFVLSFVLSMGMGYLASRDATLGWVNWAEQGVNSASQLCLMLGVIVLHRAELKGWAK